MKTAQNIPAIQLRQTKQQFTKLEGHLSTELGNAVQSLPPLYTRLIAGGICLIFTSAIAWATFSKVDEVADTQGQLIPSNPVQPVRALASGRIREIKVSERQHIKKGEFLVQLDPTMSQAELERLQQLAKLSQEELARLEAERIGATSTSTILQNQLLVSRLKDYQARQAAAKAEANRQAALIEQSKVRLSRLQENLLNAKTNAANTKINLINAENLRVNTLQLSPKIKSSLAIVQEKEKSFHYLYKKGAIARLQYRMVQDEVNKVNMEITKVQNEINKSADEVTNASNRVNEAQDKVISLGKDIAAQFEEIRQAQQSYKAAQNSISRLEAERQSEILTQINKLRSELADLNGKISQAKEQNQQNIIQAPVTGYVYNVKVNKTLGTIQTGDELFSIVPDGEQLIVEVKVNNKDIGFVKEIKDENKKMLARVKLATFPYQEFGTLEGKVEKVSPNATSDKDGNLFYTARISINQQSAKGKIQKVLLTPGMAATAEIVIRQKTIMSFLLEPIITNWDKAFSVR
ncbi:MAG: HlyD family efflux transporter periplasmic adaptor subunit [Scytonematopsis contorta HA4267-MV1]|jgi:HlyD family secretion protein|nr:HlyD family efflux transporter periplasmic adaptor subunit [Scytonematopsis contorta HA4267-MV1]